MKKVITIELDQQGETIELHLNKEGAEYLKNILNRLISNNQNDHLHLMTPDWGGNELTTDQQNLSATVKLLHQLKIVYWK
ncbi:MAG: immunity protein 32 [Tannerellaceae bacterium]|nr:immunity protein 32 [Tannerellaceae bacterium]